MFGNRNGALWLVEMRGVITVPNWFRDDPKRGLNVVVE